MEISWFGHSCFRLSEKGMAALVTDPYDHTRVGYARLNLKADIVTISHDSPGHTCISAVQGTPYIINGTGEYEVGGVFVTGVASDSNAHSEKCDERNTMYLIDYNGLNILHLGDLSRIPTQAEVEAFGPVHVLLVPVGGHGGLTASMAAEAVNLLEPSYVIPMHYATPESLVELDPVDKFLKAMGAKEAEAQPVLKISSPDALPEEMRVVILKVSGN